MPSTIPTKSPKGTRVSRGIVRFPNGTHRVYVRANGRLTAKRFAANVELQDLKLWRERERAKFLLQPKRDPFSILRERDCPRRYAPDKRSYIYFVRCGDLVKIGRAMNLFDRIRDLQIANPETITLVGYIFGNHALEQEIHQQFAAQLRRGEWYRLNQELATFILNSSL